MITLYYYNGAYKGRRDLYGKRITPYFLRFLTASFYKDAHKSHSLSLSESLVSTTQVTEKEFQKLLEDEQIYQTN